MVDGRPVVLSGTFKAYQFLDVDWASRGRHQERRHRPAEHRLHAEPRLRGLRRRRQPGHDRRRPAGRGDLRLVLPGQLQRLPGGSTSPAGTGASRWSTEPGTAIEDTPDTLPTSTRRWPRTGPPRSPASPGSCCTTWPASASSARPSGSTAGRCACSYQGTRPGHRVANEFCVDLHAAALQGRRQAAEVDADGRTATVRQAETPYNWEQHPPRSPERLGVRGAPRRRVRVHRGDPCAPPEPPTVDEAAAAPGDDRQRRDRRAAGRRLRLPHRARPARSRLGRRAGKRTRSTGDGGPVGLGFGGAASPGRPAAAAGTRGRGPQPGPGARRGRAAVRRARRDAR